jgi:hypothetical protein
VVTAQKNESLNINENIEIQEKFGAKFPILKQQFQNTSLNRLYVRLNLDNQRNVCSFLLMLHENNINMWKNPVLRKC